MSKTIAPRFHILGPGGIGSLFAYHFHHKHIPFTFFQRRAPSLVNNNEHADPSDSPATLKYMNLTNPGKNSVEPRAVDNITWEPLYPIIDKELFRLDPVYNELSRQPIHQLLVTTKTYQTLDAISKIRHRLRPWTTIVLMQNGMGVREEICESMGWTDPREQPNFVQGIISHGAQKIGNTIVHTGQGNVWLAPIDPVFADSSLKLATIPSFDNLLKLPLPSTNGSSTESLFPILTQPSMTVLSTPYPRNNPDLPFTAPFSNTSFSAFYEPLASDEHLLTLRTRSLFETLYSFNQLSADMNLKLLMPAHLLTLQLSKLAVNASVNPIGTLLEAQNGVLYEKPQANQAIRDLLTECHKILTHSAEYEALPENFQKEFLSLEALNKTTFSILKASAPNRCSTLQDYLKGSALCEIDYMNGYFIKMAERSNVDAPLNRMVTEKVKEKFALARKTENRAIA
ncbi:2-dehydropantoate 2-reductase (Ketopantoate reductase) (KPA reductase) (KPR) [Podila horticola]|nr:2-dehydropantoate 2-reductase (Ketopantoate reductase) (KPA reductase) (KPR) [Podila horticola]